ncbi:MAG: hypothetical protein OXI80_03895 [Caldilineaceae bacterium]|nr:hypothetical protein [Caldilineaceae bacterium]MDE0336791.1 hypothetical protein [Caldilineaceae bacterium]
MDSLQTSESQRTTIYRSRSSGEDAVGYVCAEEIFRVRWGTGVSVGRYERDSDGWRVFRKTRFDEKELGRVTTDGVIHSHGLFEGGSLGWLESDGTVVRGGLIFAEEEVGRVDGPESLTAAAALLLIFVPDEDEANREIERRG